MKLKMRLYVCMFLLGTQIGSNCTTDEDCSTMGNAICGPTGTCRCDRAHFAFDADTECIPGNINVADTVLQMMIFKHLCRQNSGSLVKMTTSATSRNPFVAKEDGVVRKARLHLEIIANALIVGDFNYELNRTQF